MKNVTVVVRKHVFAMRCRALKSDQIGRKCAFLLCVLLLLPGVFGFGAAQTAHAYERTGMLSYGGWELGPLVLADGRYVYCLEPGTLTPVADFDHPTVTTELRGYSVRTFDQTGWAGVVKTEPVAGIPLQQMNYLLSTYGQDDNPKFRVALQLALWELRVDSGAQDWFTHHIAWVRAHGGSWEVDRAQQLIREANDKSPHKNLPVLDNLQLSLGHDLEDDTLITGTLGYPKGTRSLQLSGASFLDGSKEQNVDPKYSGTVPWVREAHIPMWSNLHEISATGEAEQTLRQWPAQVVLYPPNDRTQQIQGAGFGASEQIIITPYPKISVDQLDVFEPVLSTAVTQQVLRPSVDIFSDVVTVTVSDTQRWPKRSIGTGDYEFLPVKVSGTLFGPFASEQEVATTAPGDARIAATKILTVASGPGSYRVDLPEVTEASGFYYWQWAIRESEQDDAVIRSALLPTDYVYQDRFAEPAEEHVVAMSFNVRTKLREHVLRSIPLSIVDDVDFSLNSGRWLQDSAGENYPVTLRLSVFQEDIPPVRSHEVPRNAKLIAEQLISGNQPVDFSDSGVIELPEGTTGWVTVRACVVVADQPDAVKPYVIPGCDDYGIPAETARIQHEKLAQSGIPGHHFVLEWFAPIGLGCCLLGMCFLSANLKRKKLFSFRSVETN